MELGGRITPESAYQMIKEELKEFKKVNSLTKRMSLTFLKQHHKIGKIFGIPLKSLVHGILKIL